MLTWNLVRGTCFTALYEAVEVVGVPQTATVAERLAFLSESVVKETLLVPPARSFIYLQKAHICKEQKTCGVSSTVIHLNAEAQATPWRAIKTIFTPQKYLFT